ncbi:MAG TPA: ATP-dependent DNA helicase RecG [Candidatus Saccharimonadales bacterium]|nr:ATP-dependent DNA helicase RecG [Candidatus Saccharimonadales bacterium]
MLKQPVTTIKGVGNVLADKLYSLGVETVEDLLYFFPRKYDDFSQVVPIAQLKPGKVTVKGMVESVAGRHIRRGLHITEAVIADGSAKTRAVWFNQSYRAAQLSKGEEYYFSGTYDLQRNRYVLQNPASEQVKSMSVSTARIVPIYRETAGLKSHQLRKVMLELVPLMKMLPETLPSDLIKRENLLDIHQTLQSIHFPEEAKDLEAAKARISFEEIFTLMLASVLNKKDVASLKGWKVPFLPEVAKAFTGALPFTMTGAQRKAAWEILQDMEKGEPMNRLLQGDVGSGKTLVAAMAAFMAARGGLQTAFMAPTEILATQHAKGLADLLEPMGVRVALLVGSTKPKAKENLKLHIASGDVDVVVGTHALIQKDSAFHKLGLVVIDEQHRFGVAQRAELLKHGDHMPHLLSMTATPIPRSLQLTVYGELEVSILNELPKGRQPITTKVVSPLARHSVYEHIDKEIKAGRQAYVVCPLVADGGANVELKSVEAEHARLTKSVFKHRRLGLLHGQMKADEKELVMRLFKNKELDVLISTTVIEVGVDVPNATVMLIEGAERFGLAQLHQLRGRVGRGSEQSYCYVVPTTVQSVSQRLRELEQSTDGFYLAEVDLKLRGPGEIYGRAQHGALNLSFANLADTKLLKRARDAAAWLVDTQVNLLQYKRLHEHVDRYRRLTKLN